MKVFKIIWIEGFSFGRFLYACSLNIHILVQKGAKSPAAPRKAESAAKPATATNKVELKPQLLAEQPLSDRYISFLFNIHILLLFGMCDRCWSCTNRQSCLNHRWKSWWTRIFYSFVLVGTFCVIIALGHLYLALLVLLLEHMCFYEINSIAFKVNKAREEQMKEEGATSSSIPLFRTISLYVLLFVHIQ